MAPNTSITGLGCDISHHNVDARGRPVDWVAVFSAGIRFVFIKASDGDSFRDPEFLNSARGARAAGLAVGAYHFLRPGPQADEQAKLFLDQLQSAGGADLFSLGAALDVEDADDDPGAWDKLPATERVQKVLHWLEGVSEIFPSPLIYCIPQWFGDHISSDRSLATYRLWAASPSGPPALQGSPWSIYALWQYKFTGTVNGLGFKNVDLDRPKDNL